MPQNQIKLKARNKAFQIVLSSISSSKISLQA